MTDLRNMPKTIVVVYRKTMFGKRYPAGKAEIVEVIRYAGDGWYRVKAHFPGDPADCVQELETNIDNKTR